MPYRQTQLVSRLEICGLSPSAAKAVVNQIDFWVEHSGTEWTVARLKLIKQSILAIRANQCEKVSPYVKTRNKHLVGPFRQVENMLWKGYSKSLAAMMIYTSYVSQTVTKSQETKWLKAVRSPYPDQQLELEPNTFLVASQLLDYTHLPRIYSLERPYSESTGWSAQKRAPTSDGRSVPETEKGEQLLSFMKTGFFRRVNRVLDGLLSEDAFYVQDQLLGNLVEKEPTGSRPLGKVSCIQEPGFKARFIANPNRVVQYLFKPLGDWLFALIKQLPWDCCHDQQRGLAHVKDAIAAGVCVYSYDLINATDNFPLATQVYTAWAFASAYLPQEQLYLIESQLRLFSVAAREPFQFRNSEGVVSNVSWTRGQPLGLYPSFPLFSLAHGLLLFECWLEYLKSTNNMATSSEPKSFTVRIEGKGTGQERSYYVGPPFLIVGDDVVVFVPEIAYLYTSKLKELEVPISLEKSFSSDILSEFVGHLVVGSNYYVPTKWRQVSVSSFLDFIRVWGIEAISLLPRHLRKVAKVLAGLPEPIGLGFNPLGIALSERLRGFEELYMIGENCPILLPSKKPGDASTIVSFLEKLPQRCGVVYNLPLFHPEIFAEAVHKGRPVPLARVFQDADPRFIAEFVTLSKFQDLWSPQDLRHFVNDLLSRYPTSATLGSLVRAFGAETSQLDVTLDSNKMLFFKVRDILG